MSGNLRGSGLFESDDTAKMFQAL